MDKPRRVRPASPARRVPRHHPHEGQPADVPATPPPGPPEGKPSNLEALALYERGVEALQRRDFWTAADRFREVLDRYPEERDLHERVRLYLKLCERQAAPRDAVPTTPEERIFAATLALNAGSADRALEHLRRVDEEAPENDHGQYMLAVVYAHRGDTHAALAHLTRAIELNPENRALARQDPDLEAIRSDEGFRAVLDTASPSAGRRRVRPRPLR
jgi:tetratricopeptide (TPR) repeat protein